jgi:hypothetical protein
VHVPEHVLVVVIVGEDVALQRHALGLVGRGWTLTAGAIPSNAARL